MEITPLPSVEKTAEVFFDNNFKWVDIENGLGKYLLMTDIAEHLKAKLTQRDDHAYTSLVEGIEGMKNKVSYTGGGFRTIGEIREAQAYDQALLDIIEKVVKPLYGKE